jgi:general secretion pathway protein G
MKKLSEYIKSKRSTQGQKGFSMLEIIIVLAIIGTLFGIFIPQLTGSQQKAKINETGIKAGQLQGALLKYSTDVGRFPTTQEGLNALLENPGHGNWAGPYLSLDDIKDAWQTPFEYELSPKGPKLISAGPDLQPGTDDDIAFLNGKKVDNKPDNQP